MFRFPYDLLFNCYWGAMNTYIPFADNNFPSLWKFDLTYFMVFGDFSHKLKYWE